MFDYRAYLKAPTDSTRTRRRRVKGSNIFCKPDFSVSPILASLKATLDDPKLLLRVEAGVV